MTTSMPPLTRRPEWTARQDHYRKIQDVHLRTLCAGDPQRGERLTLEAAGLYLDYSKHRITDETLRLLVTLAESSGLRHRIDAMFRGDRINNILRHANVGRRGRTIDAETTPLRNPEHYRYELNIADIAEVWRRGSVVASWLLDLAAMALIEQPELKTFSGRVSDSGEGRWTVTAAIDEGAPAPVLTAALYQRFTSRGEDDFAAKVLSAMRYKFGGATSSARPAAEMTSRANALVNAFIPGMLLADRVCPESAGTE